MTPFKFEIRDLWSGLSESLGYRPTKEEILKTPDEKTLERERFEEPPAESIASTKYYESVFRWTPAQIAAAQPAFWFEIARMRVPPSALGIITRLWTHIGYIADLGDGETERIPLNDPSEPWKHEAFIDNVYGFRLRWRLQLESIRWRDDPVAPLYFIQEAELPGLPWGQDPTWTDQRYAWGNHARNVRLIVPENHTVRLFVGIDGDCWNDLDCGGA